MRFKRRFCLELPAIWQLRCPCVRLRCPRVRLRSPVLRVCLWQNIRTSQGEGEGESMMCSEDGMLPMYCRTSRVTAVATQHTSTDHPPSPTATGPLHPPTTRPAPTGGHSTPRRRRRTRSRATLTSTGCNSPLAAPCIAMRRSLSFCHLSKCQEEAIRVRSSFLAIFFSVFNSVHV